MTLLVISAIIAQMAGMPGMNNMGMQQRQQQPGFNQQRGVGMGMGNNRMPQRSMMGMPQQQRGSMMGPSMGMQQQQLQQQQLQQQSPQLSAMSSSPAGGNTGSKDCSYCDAQGVNYVCAQMGTRLASLKNACYATCQQMTIKFHRKCKQSEVDAASGGGDSSSGDGSSGSCDECSSEYKPVCGDDDTTYDNVCQAKCKNIKKTTPGECSEDSSSDNSTSTDTGNSTSPIMNPDLGIKKTGSSSLAVASLLFYSTIIFLINF